MYQLSKRSINMFFVFVFFVLFFILFTSACSINNVKNRWGDMSPKEKVIWMFDVYNNQYDDYMVQMGYVKKDGGKWEKETSPVLTPEKKNILMKKKEVLNNVYPLIQIYDAAVMIDKIPDPSTEAAIIGLLEKLLSIL